MISYKMKVVKNNLGRHIFFSRLQMQIFVFFWFCVLHFPKNEIIYPASQFSLFSRCPESSKRKTRCFNNNALSVKVSTSAVKAQKKNAAQNNLKFLWKRVCGISANYPKKLKFKLLETLKTSFRYLNKRSYNGTRGFAPGFAIVKFSTSCKEAFEVEELSFLTLRESLFEFLFSVIAQFDLKSLILLFYMGRFQNAQIYTLA